MEEQDHDDQRAAHLRPGDLPPRSLLRGRRGGHDQRRPRRRHLRPGHGPRRADRDPGKYAAYASGASDGTQTAKGFLRDACVVSSGNVTLKDETGITRKYAAMYYSGVFKTSELTGLDAGGLEDLNANLISGTRRRRHHSGRVG
jgi:hypothetical protein